MTTNYNPDVLSCLANLSNDEVFTPPALANEMLDLLPSSIWQNPNITFLDPVCKTGVFLREIAKRLDKGLEKKIPDRQKRIDHICTKQLFGIAITELTSLLSRRSVYCSKAANGKYSICSAFDNEQGNILYTVMKHTWHNGRCSYCAASQEVYARKEGLESYAYNFIHVDDPQTIFKMKFDVIVGNPPYQLSSDGGTRDVPIYNKFVEQAKRLNPQFLCMIIPSRWMAGGLGLADFRNAMLADKSIKKLIDYPVSSEVFAGVEVKGGICFFLREKDYKGACEVTTIRNGEIIASQTRSLNEYDVLVRDGNALPILRKVLKRNETSITDILSVDKEFGWTSNFTGFHDSKKEGDIPLYYIKKGKRNIGWIARNDVSKSVHLINSWKVMVPKAGSDGGQKIPDSVLGKSLIAASPSVCTQSFLFFFLNSKAEAESLESYYRTRFFRFLVSLRKFTQDATRSTYIWVPIQSWDRTWTDKELYEKYDLTDNEITYIETVIKSMDVN